LVKTAARKSTGAKDGVLETAGEGEPEQRAREQGPEFGPFEEQHGCNGKTGGEGGPSRPDAGEDNQEIAGREQHEPAFGRELAPLHVLPERVDRQERDEGVQESHAYHDVERILQAKPEQDLEHPGQDAGVDPRADLVDVVRWDVPVRPCGEMPSGVDVLKLLVVVLEAVAEENGRDAHQHRDRQ
jgi:hypothetical protein